MKKEVVNIYSPERDKSLFHFFINRICEFFICSIVGHSWIKIEWEPDTEQLFDPVNRGLPKSCDFCTRCWIDDKN